MKILIDTEVLALSQLHEEARTGVYRVVKNVIEGIIFSGECEVYYSAAHPLEKEAYSYMNSNKLLGSRPIIYPSIMHKRLNRWKDRSAVIEKEIGVKLNSSKSVVNKSLYRVVRRVLYEIRKSNSPYCLADKFALSSMDIYHSPFYPFPNFILHNTSVIKFLTIYDLIPVLFPHYFQHSGGEHMVTQAIRRLGPSGYGFAISQSTKDDLCNYQKDINPENIFVTHLAASREVFYQCTHPAIINAVKKKYNIPDGPYFLGLSTLEPRKNIDHIIRCFSNLIQEQNLPELNLVLVGAKGWKFEKIFSELESAGSIKKRIILTGYVADEDLAAVYSGALGFIYPSFYEGFGLPPLEAMQCGIPVITSNTSSLPEVVGDAGIMVDPRDSDALCQSMLDVYSNEALRGEMSKKSLEQAKKFSWEKCVQQTIEGYKKAVYS